ncbi:hypothetical protein KIN20_021553 [Parelaphostrongylus tenuis]|uniref:Uncharacterized protein n=1 Tax=Parelaphostrongylus tenuis TaxID=148309 RepID=A0AAD5QUP7_PARTN|nr:hypothetical protein KIN20_021553 [Parelaphostrongylus tenuis]
METVTDADGVVTKYFLILLFATLSIVLGCGVMPAGQGSTRNFAVSGFTLPVSMAYSSATDVQAQVPSIASSEAGAKGFVDRLVKQTVFDVLESQARSALLPDAVISVILSQLTVTVTYTPLMCSKVRLTVENPDPLGMMESACIIFDNTVTAICSYVDEDRKTCTLMPGNDRTARITSVPSTHLTISGSLSTTNIIMASWLNTMWQSVVNRALRMLPSDPLGRHFVSAIATVGGN